MEDNLSIETERLLALIIMHKMPKFSNSYDLNKILSWKFGVINLSIIIRDLLKNDLIINENNKANSVFSITEKGLRYLSINLDKFRCDLNKKFPNEVFLNYLF